MQMRVCKCVSLFKTSKWCVNNNIDIQIFRYRRKEKSLCNEKKIILKIYFTF